MRDALRSNLDVLPDADLLDRFTRYADHPAFEALVRRHGPMVLGVCRRTLAGSVDADDAFQATFLVLIRKARGLRRADRLGPWLYGVAVRVARKARARAARFAAHRSESLDMVPDTTAPPEHPDWLPILDVELNALPAKYRDPLVLCELQGASRADGARALGVKEGTLSSRLARGRALLRERLLKHGTLLPSGGLAALFTAENVGRATVPGALLARTAELAKAPAGAIPVGAAQLTDEVLKSMFLTKLRTAGGLLAAFALAAVGLAAAPGLGEVPGNPPERNTPLNGIAATVAPVEAPPPRPLPLGGKQPAGVPARLRPPEGPAPLTDKVVGRSDRDRLQGLWKLEKHEVVGPDGNALTGNPAMVRKAPDAGSLNEMVDKDPDVVAERSRAERARRNYETQLHAGDPKNPAPGVLQLKEEYEQQERTWLKTRRIKLMALAGPDRGKEEKDGGVTMTTMLVVGDVWWQVWTGPRGSALRTTAVLDPTKNPKWLDWSRDAAGGEPLVHRCIYELDGDALRVCFSHDDPNVRPAEFAPDPDVRLVVMQFRRGTMPPAVGEKALVGSWVGVGGDITGVSGTITFVQPAPRVEILDGHAFVFGSANCDGAWSGGRYSVDTTKNPKWIDIELTPSADGEPTAKMYGCYELADGRLKLSLGTKRATRPLAFDGTQGRVFDLKRAAPELAPAPRAKTSQAARDTDAELRAWIRDNAILARINAGETDAAEKLLRRRLPDRTGLDAALDRLLIGICVVERARKAPPDAAELWAAAAELFCSAELAARDAPPGNARAEWIRNQAALRILQVLNYSRQPDRLLAAAPAVAERRRGTVEELIVLSLVYHAHLQKGEAEKARATRREMRAAFERLKEKPGAFTATTAEHGRKYWEELWFKDGHAEQ